MSLFRFARSLPRSFRLDPNLMRIWGALDHLPRLKDHIKDTKEIDAIHVAIVPGRRSFLLDGMTRLWSRYELGLEGVELPFPAVREKCFAGYGDAIREAVRIQTSRRNLSPGQVAMALLDAEKAAGKSTARRRGRPHKSGRAEIFPTARCVR